jgi:peptide/nickel transport system substrate-binding protein
MPTHYIPPQVPRSRGVRAGLEGFGLDFMTKDGKPIAQVSAGVLQEGGLRFRQVRGHEEILMVGTGEGVAQKVAEIAKENFERMGFKVRLRLVTQDSMYTKFCNVPSADVHVCPNVGWLKDFSDAQTSLDPTFNGKNILEENNSNWSELDVPAINAPWRRPRRSPLPRSAPKAWADINKQVTEQAPAIPYVWDKNPLLSSKNVNAVASGVQRPVGPDLHLGQVGSRSVIT